MTTSVRRLLMPLIGLAAIVLGTITATLSVDLLLLSLLVVAVVWFTLGSLVDPYSAVGNFLLLTLLRPLPSVFGSPYVVGRLIDAIWLGFAFVLLGISARSQTNGRMVAWKTFGWLFVFAVTSLVSLVAASFVQGQDVVPRDFFELYRMPYYYIVFLIAARLSWPKEELIKHFFRPMLIGIWVMVFISALQMNPFLNAALEQVYTLKSALLSDTVYGFRLRNCGTFSNPNYFGVGLALLIPFLFSSFYLFDSHLSRLLCALSTIAAFGLVVSTGSRTAWIVTVAVVVCYVFRMGGIGNNFMFSRRTLTLIITGLVVASLLAIVIPRLERFQTTLAETAAGGLQGIRSSRVKYDTTQVFVREVIQTAPVFEMGPSKSVDDYLGDNQYSRLFYRYGAVGLACWLLFWTSLFRKASNAIRHTANDTPALFFSVSLLSMVLAFVLANVGGPFFDATQVATLAFILVGVSSRVSNSQTDHSISPMGNFLGVTAQ